MIQDFRVLENVVTRFSNHVKWPRDMTVSGQ